ncbi:MAG: 50S ribosomal protein L9, partial [Oligoflexia bacterium]|nr:50S ribosomal protein L9 [Oligoflexia bacterium]
MELILQKDVKNLGKAGDQVSVKNGFARNFLIPKGYALLLNKEHLKTWNHQKVIISAKKRKAVSERKILIEKLAEINLVFEKESQKDNKIFGSVTAHEISQALEKQHNISVDKKDIHFSELKTVGEHKVSIRLDSELKTEILLNIKGKVRKKREEK